MYILVQVVETGFKCSSLKSNAIKPIYLFRIFTFGWLKAFELAMQRVKLWESINNLFVIVRAEEASRACIINGVSWENSLLKSSYDNGTLIQRISMKTSQQP